MFTQYTVISIIRFFTEKGGECYSIFSLALLKATYNVSCIQIPTEMNVYYRTKETYIQKFSSMIGKYPPQMEQIHKCFFYLFCNISKKQKDSELRASNT